MSTGGLDSHSSTEQDSALLLVKKVLAREQEIDALPLLLQGVRGEKTEQPEAATIAFGFDTNAIFRFGQGRVGADCLDFLRTQHKGPVIVAGQTLQELWNNKLAEVIPQAQTLKRKFDDLETEVNRIGEAFGEVGVRAKDALDAMITEFGYLVDPSLQQALEDTLDVLTAVGKVSFVPRSEFSGLAMERHDTKTPPGFRDTGHGDFFVWADFLLGLARLPKNDFDSVIFVTEDSKADWSRHGIAHPLLVAEATAVCGKPFALWSLQDFRNFVTG